MSQSSPASLREYVVFAHKLADASGETVLPYFRNIGEIGNKELEGFDPVTEADRGSERVMREMIETHYPGHGILGEEFPAKAASEAFEWVLDPIDGTKAFISGLPLWGTLIGLRENGKPILGMMNQPYLGERFWNAEDSAHFRNRQGEGRIATRPCASLREANIGTTTPDMFRGSDMARFQALASACRMTRYGADCYMYCMLAAGFVDLVCEAELKPFDIAPLIPIIEAAGGKVTSWDGGDAANGGHVLASGDPHIHDAALRLLSS